jgi:class 3 adenylate cyclase
VNKKLLSLYGLKWNPFAPEVPVEALLSTPKVDNFCWRIENLAREGGFALVTGDPGSGKSFALRLLVERLSALRDVQVGLLSRPQARAADFYREMGDVFGVQLVPHNRWAGAKALREQWQRHIDAALFRPVLVVDEAQEMPSAVLNELRLLSSSRLDPLRIALENKTDARALPTVWIAGDKLHDLLGHRRPFLTAKRLLTNQTFRDIYRTDAMDVDQRLKITSLTFLFTDLRGSTDLYERVGDLAAYDLVKAHFRVLGEIVASETGAVVKTIGDAVMATFATPDRAVAAALKMREGMRVLNGERKRDDLLLKIGIHEGPCLAVMLNDRQDYFGQTVNIASRVQSLSDARSILVTTPVIENAQTSKLLETAGLKCEAHRAALRGVTDEVSIYAIP